MWAFRGCVCSLGWAIGVFREKALRTCCVFSICANTLSFTDVTECKSTGSQCWCGCTPCPEIFLLGRPLVIYWWCWIFSCSALMDILRDNRGMWNWAGFETCGDDCGLCLPVVPKKASPGLQEQILQQIFGKCGAQACAGLPYLPVLSTFLTLKWSRKTLFAPTAVEGNAGNAPLSPDSSFFPLIVSFESRVL